jgi:hypothetical protein
VFAVRDFNRKKRDNAELLTWGSGFYQEEQQGLEHWHWGGSQADLAGSS